MIEYFPKLPINIRREEIYHLLGYKKKSVKIPEKIVESVNKELIIGRELLRFKGVYAVFDAEVRESDVSFSNGFNIKSTKFAAWAARCNRIYVFVVTAGVLFSERTSQLIKGENLSMALIADAVGSAAAEACAREANRFIVSLEKGKKLTKRYSPGYGDWDIVSNRELLQLLEADKIGITVNEGGLMQPEKSVSAAIGIKSMKR